jgi:hypothetical protein
VNRRSFFKKNGQSQTDIGSQTGGQAVDSSSEKNERWIRSACALCEDVKSQKLQFQTKAGTRTALLLYCEGLADIKQITHTIVPSLEDLLLSDQSPDTWHVAPLHFETDLENVIAKVFRGALAIFVDGIGKAYMLDINNPPHRTPEEPNTEVSIRGPRDGFVEELTVNVALVRKRLRTRSLACETFVFGSRSQTRTALLYMEDILNPEVRNEIRHRLSNINIDAVYTSSQLEEYLADSSFSIVPLFHYTGRPDHVVTSLLLGRFVILLDGLPTALIGPANFFLLLKSPEDYHVNYLYVIMERLVRFLGASLAVFLPGFYIAITTYHQDQIPLTLLATFITARKGVPFPTPVEAFIMLILFEVLREAGLRLPGVIGQTLSVVGGLIIGESAISAGLTSPSMLVMIGTTIIASFTLINQSLLGVVSVLRFGVLLLCSLFGLYGFLMSVFALLTYLASLRSFGLPYLAPLPPFNSDLLRTVARLPWLKRPRMLHTQDDNRQGGTG